LLSPLSPYEEKILEQARSMVPGQPPKPWRHNVFIHVGGLQACGWDMKENLVIISSNGYSINTADGNRLVRDMDYETTFDAITSDSLKFVIPATQEKIDIFGLMAGGGIYVAPDLWRLQIVYPWWPKGVVLLKSPASRGYLEGQMIDSGSIDGWLHCGFSPSGQHFIIFGSAGLYWFSR
jgi:hypothetical protein